VGPQGSRTYRYAPLEPNPDFGAPPIHQAPEKRYGCTRFSSSRRWVLTGAESWDGGLGASLDLAPCSRPLILPLVCLPRGKKAKNMQMKIVPRHPQHYGCFRGAYDLEPPP
jgi:hypothetical protein